MKSAIERAQTIVEDVRNACYPSNKHFTTTFFYRHGKLMARKKSGQDPEFFEDANEQTLSVCARDTQVDEEAYKAARTAHAEWLKQMREEFAKAVADENDADVDGVRAVMSCGDYGKINMDNFHDLGDVLDAVKAYNSVIA